mgnify:CR=1 FL=1
MFPPSTTLMRLCQCTCVRVCNVPVHCVRACVLRVCCVCVACVCVLRVLRVRLNMCRRSIGARPVRTRRPGETGAWRTSCADAGRAAQMPPRRRDRDGAPRRAR